MNRWIKPVSMFVAGFGILYITFAIGEFSGLVKGVRRQAQTDAERTLILVEKGKIDWALELELLHPDSVEALKKQAAEHGKPKQMRIRRIDSTPWGLPVIVSIDVTRNGVAFEEGLTRHGTESAFDFWVDSRGR